MTGHTEPGRPSVEPPVRGLSDALFAAAERDLVRERLRKKNKLRGDVVAYLVVNAFLIGAWAATGFGYFWPGWVAGAWGLLLVLDAWSIFNHRTVTEEDVDRELRRRRR